MKTKLALLLLLLFSSINYSQNQTKIKFTENDKLIYLDSLGKKTSESDHLYYRIIKDYKLDKASYQVYDFYKSGALHVEGTSGNKEWVLKNGLFVSYYENGTKKMTANFVNRKIDGLETVWYENGNKKSIKNYVNGKSEGVVIQWYENGNKKLEEVKVYTTRYENTTFLKTSEYKILNFWDENGVQKVVDGNGDYEETSKNYNAKGKVKNGYKDGLWSGHFTDKDFSYSETYVNKEIVSGISVDKNKVSRNYTQMRTLPVPVRGMPDFLSHISRNFRSPDVELRGKIYIGLMVAIDGSVEDIEVLRDLGPGTAEEAIRVVKSYTGGWIPGEVRGQKARLPFSFPISLQTAK